MEKANDINNYVKNIKYYADKIREAARGQMEIDYRKAEQLGINIEHGALRFNALGIIESNCEWFNVYGDNVLANLKSAEKVDKELYIPEEDDEGF